MTRGRAASVASSLTKHVRPRNSSRGQSLVELALILPFLLGFAGAATDFARVYQASVNLESSVRNAVEYVATNSADATAAATDARRIVCLESTRSPGFTPGTGANPNENCTAPAVTVVSFVVSPTALGASGAYPIGTAHVRATLVFNTLLPYPFLPEGGWTLTADATYSVVRGR
jgi:Flp pilus assembly protein TadG